MSQSGSVSIYLIVFVVLAVIVLAFMLISFVRVGRRRRQMGEGAPRMGESGQQLRSESGEQVKAGPYEKDADPRGDDIGGNFADVPGMEETHKDSRGENRRR